MKAIRVAVRSNLGRLSAAGSRSGSGLRRIAGAAGLASLIALGGASFAACVPTGSAPPYDAGAQPAVASSSFRPSLNVMSAVFEDNFDRPDATAESTSPSATGATLTAAPGADASPTATSTSSAAARDGGLALVTRDGGPDAAVATLIVPMHDGGSDGGSTGDRGNLGPNWIPAKTSAWKVENGMLCGQGAHNHGIWLNRTLPVNARIEFDATSQVDDGDLKTEVWGDGVSFATGTSYTNATSYLAILGGWKNTIHALARLNEHGTDRKEIHVDKDSDDPRQRPVQKGQTYHFKIERTDGKTIRWSVDGVDFLTWNDPSPLAGQGHDHFGFNEWEAKVCFDNVKVTPL